jgi:galactose mutarotase-like enzyme
MKTLIENNILVVESKTAGAELTSIRVKSDDTEYLWQGDPKYWGGQSPILFPFVCAVADSKYAYKGQQYEMGNHGFARKQEFDLASVSADSVTYRLVSTKEIYKNYPFKFSLDISYALKGNALAVGYSVLNAGAELLYFSIGAHTGFRCPIAQGDEFTDYYLEFERPETLDRQFLNAANLLIAGKKEPLLKNEKALNLTPELFAEGALVLEGVKSQSLALKGRKTNKAVTVSLPGFPRLGLWTKPGAPFVCIEPWYGISESTDFKGDLTQKVGILNLKPGEMFKSEYQIIIS